MANINSNIVISGQNIKSVPPGTVAPVLGSLVVPATTTPTLNDTWSLFTMPAPSSHIINGWIQLPLLDATNTLRLKLFDGTNNIITGITAGAASNIVVPVSALAATIGSPVSYIGGSALGPITLTVTTTAGGTTGGAALTIYFGFEITMD